MDWDDTLGEGEFHETACDLILATFNAEEIGERKAARILTVGGRTMAVGCASPLAKKRKVD